MLLYVNGDSHTAAAEAVNPHGWEGDDANFDHTSKRPHPDNLAVSWGQQLATMLGWDFECQAQAGGSNQRVLRTVREWLDHNKKSDVFIVLQWSTWEREEWMIDGEYYDVNASGIDHVPDSARERYKKFIIDVDWPAAAQRAHDQIWHLHCDLKNAGIPHLFFCGNMSFNIAGDLAQRDWQDCFVGPYDCSLSYSQVLASHGFVPKPPGNYHYGADGHCFWAKYLLQYIKTHNLTGNHAISTD